MQGKDFIKLYKKTKEEGCNKKCNRCELYLDDTKGCIHHYLEEYDKWLAKKRKEK